MLHLIKEKEEWYSKLKLFSSYDFYHTYDYHQLCKKRDEKPVLISYEQENTSIIFPLLLRPIPHTNYFDAVSVYGYPGPLSNNLEPNVNYQDFYENLKIFFIKNRIVSVFSRLNPLIKNQESILSQIGNIEELGEIVNIDLTQENEKQIGQYSKTTKRYLNKSRKILHSKLIESKEDILKFIELYYATMERVDAKTSYFFESQYFFDIISSSEFKTDIIAAVLKDTEEIISAAMMIKTNNHIIQYHLSGTNPDYMHLTPMRFLIDEMRKLGVKEKYTYFNLGGGLGSKEDSLFRFKSSFSKDFKKFKVWKYIVNQEIYDQLTEKYNDSNCSKNTNFFPAYRFPD